MKRILLRRDLDAFDPKALHVGGSLLSAPVGARRGSASSTGS